LKKIEHIKNLLNHINEEKIAIIKSEIHQKELWVLNVAIKGGIFDKTHTLMVLDYIRDNKNPQRPETLNKLMVQLISSVFSYNRIRKQLRKRNREWFNTDDYPIREDHERILAYLLHEERFENEDFWHPQKFELLIKEIDANKKYKEQHIFSDYWLEYIMDILRTAPSKLTELTNQNINEFYEKVDRICSQDYEQDVFRKSEVLWDLATEMSVGIKNVGTNLMCDFLKESGFTDYAKMDIHMIRSMSEVLNVYSCSKLTDSESFVVTQWLANKITMTPFKLDKIQYVYGMYNKV
jgi:hypothetical protein